jgi:hypothetical protein
MDLNAVLLEDEFLVCAFINILEASETAYIVNEHVIEICATRSNVLDELNEPGPSLDSKPAAPFIKIGSDNCEIVLLRVRSEGGSLILDRVSLMIRGHSSILRGPKRIAAARELGLTDDERSAGTWQIG